MCQVPRFILPPALYLIRDPLRFFRALPVLFRGASSFTTFSHEVFFLLQNNANPMPNPIFCQHAPSCHYYSHKTTATSDKTAQTLPYFHIPPSVPQTSQRNHLHPILPGISHLPSRQHNQKARQSQHLPPLLLIPLPYQIPQGQQMPGSILDIPASQLAHHKGIPPVRQIPRPSSPSMPSLRITPTQSPPFGHLAAFCSVVWPTFVRSFGRTPRHAPIQPHPPNHAPNR